MPMPGETEEQRPEDNIEMKERQQRQNDQDEIYRQFDQQDENAQRETTFINPGASTSQQVDLGGTEEENRQSELRGDAINRETNESKQKNFSAFFNAPLRSEMDLDFFQRTKFVPRKGMVSVATITYDGKEIYFIRGGEVRAYTDNKNQAEGEAFDERLEEKKTIIKNSNFSNALIVDRRLSAKQIETFDKYFTDAVGMDRQGQIEKVEELDQKVLELETTDDKNLAEKAKQFSDKIRMELLAKFPKYDITSQKIETTAKNDILDRMRRARDQLKRFREWVRSRFPVIAALVAFTAGVFSIVFAVVKLTKGTVEQTAKATHSIGKTIGKILARFGHMMTSVGSFIISLLSFLAQGIMWVANNLWVLFVALVMYAWNKWKSQRKYRLQ